MSDYLFKKKTFSSFSSQPQLAQSSDRVFFSIITLKRLKVCHFSMQSFLSIFRAFTGFKVRIYYLSRHTLLNLNLNTLNWKLQNFYYYKF